MADGRGRIFVTTNGKTPLATMVADSEGGSFVVSLPAGKQAAVKLKATPAGGEVDVFNSLGEAVVWLEATSAGNGRFTIGRAGKIYIQAAVLQNGKGMIIAGPRVGGAPPGLVIPYYLEGR
jgi:hypothetical protein